MLERWLAWRGCAGTRARVRLVRDGGEWVAALERLMGDVELGGRLGKAGRKKAEARYCPQVTGARVVEVVRGAMGGL